MDISDKKNCVIIHDTDLLQGTIDTTLKKMGANPEKFYILSSGSKYHLHNMVDILSKALSDLEDKEDGEDIVELIGYVLRGI